MSHTPSRSLTPAEQWKKDTDPIIDSLVREGQSGLHDKDELGWIYHTVGRLQSGQFDRIDLAHIVTTFLTQADSLFTAARFSFQQCILMLLLLKHSPDSDSETHNNWKDILAHQRIRIENMIDENPSIKLFVNPMIRYAWPIARAGAKCPLKANYDRIEEHCPWSAHEIAGYDFEDPGCQLIETRALPFDDTGLPR